MLDKLTGQKLVCPWWLCFTFDNPLRKLLHNPEAILGSYIQPGTNVIDLGAGMGYFSIPMAKLVGPAGHVTAIDIQTKMLWLWLRKRKDVGFPKESLHISPALAPWIIILKPISF